ncbi:hypothetical protein FRC05_011535 [Tulasnella sp. 425]|nr:hypothetical protein FRC05_011535 [Tulasnella sp. 425]
MASGLNADHTFDQRSDKKRRGTAPISAGKGDISGGRGVVTPHESSSKPSTGRTITSGTVFAGRPTGGGSRATIYGTSVYGSGYTYADNGRWVAGRGFPFGYWPIYIWPSYYGSNEFGPWNNASRPGGNMSYAQLLPPTPDTSQSRRALVNPRQAITNNATAPYFVVGDHDSVEAILVFLRSKCRAIIGNATDFNADLNPLPVEQYLQYYRASSFALALSTYSNSAASVANQPPSNDSTIANLPPAAIPPGTNLDFLQCVNTTIGNNISSGHSDLMADSSVGAMVGLFWILFVFWSSVLS